MTPPAGGTDLTGVVAAIEALTAAVDGSAVDLAPITAQIERVADAAEASNTQIASVIGAGSDGADRVRTEPLAP